MKQYKVAIIHHKIILGGGSEAVALWVAEALKHDYDVTLITSTEVKLTQLNSFYGTNLLPDEVSIIQIPPPSCLRNPDRLVALRGYKLARYCKRVAPEFDLMFSAYNPMDFGVRGIQYVLDPNFNEELLRALNPSLNKWKKWFYRDHVFRNAYLSFSKYLSKFSREGMLKNLTIVDSDWAGRLTTQVLCMQTKTIYPPVLDLSNDVSWNRRENGFVCIGRIVRDKELGKIIEILKIVREKGHSVHLHIIGKASDKQYLKKIRDITDKNKDWIFLEGSVDEDSKKTFITSHKFAIHGKKNEPFGISVAEMVKGGCLVWVPNKGGQVEIVNHPHLIYDDIEEGVNKIEKVLKSYDLQDTMRKHLRKQAEKFSVERFKTETRDLVHRFLKEDVIESE